MRDTWSSNRKNRNLFIKDQSRPFYQFSLVDYSLDENIDKRDYEQFLKSKVTFQQSRVILFFGKFRVKYVCSSYRSKEVEIEYAEKMYRKR